VVQVLLVREREISTNFGRLHGCARIAGFLGEFV
jgi:hypothetical protein